MEPKSPSCSQRAPRDAPDGGVLEEADGITRSDHVTTPTHHSHSKPCPQRWHQVSCGARGMLVPWDSHGQRAQRGWITPKPQPLSPILPGTASGVPEPSLNGQDRGTLSTLGGRRGCPKHQPPWESPARTALLSNRAARLSFFPSPSLQFIFLTRSMMLLQTANNRDRVSAKAISKLNQS